MKLHSKGRAPLTQRFYFNFGAKFISTLILLATIWKWVSEDSKKKIAIKKCIQKLFNKFVFYTFIFLELSETYDTKNMKIGAKK